MSRFLLLCGYLFFALSSMAQKADTTLVNDPTVILTDSSSINLTQDTLLPKRSFFYRTFKADYPNPKKAALLAIVPGMGQVYNKKWWKVPLVYGAFVGIGYAIQTNKEGYDLYQRAFLLKANNPSDPMILTDSLDITNAILLNNLNNASVNTLQTIRNGYDKNLQLSYIGAVLIYLLQGVDAFVDAHLLSFDIDEDLSVQVDPVFIPTPQNTRLGLGLSLHF